MIKGNISGLKTTILAKLETLYDLKPDKHSLLWPELAYAVNDVRKLLKRELCVVMNRQGKIVDVWVGKLDAIELPTVEKSVTRLSGFRVIHTHPSGSSELSQKDFNMLLELQLDAVLALGDTAGEMLISTGFCEMHNNKLVVEEFKNMSLDWCMGMDFRGKLLEIENAMAKCPEQTTDNVERAILVGTDSEESLRELAGLAEACDVMPVHMLFQKRGKVHSALYAGYGKVQEIAGLRQQKNANLVIFDDELSGSQVRNLEEEINCRVIDRTTLILDIFARRAKTKEGMLQVELAMLNHKLPRLKDANANLARIKGGVGMKGGIGMRGPGEKKLETDKRHIKSRIEEISSELERMASQRSVQKTRRKKNSITQIAIVGYTNAGKSTLRNKLCEFSPSNISGKEGVLEADMLFATLDTTVRAISLPDNRKVALSDTVGFISKLPHELVEAFKSTLEEVLDAELLLHVVDASSENAIKQIKAVDLVLGELGASSKKTILVLNKLDMAEEENIAELRAFLRGQRTIEVSALTGANLDDLLQMIGDEIPAQLVEKEFLIPYSQQKLLHMLHQNASILDEDHIAEGTRIKALVLDDIYSRCMDYEILSAL